MSTVLDITRRPVNIAPNPEFRPEGDDLGALEAAKLIPEQDKLSRVLECLTVGDLMRTLSEQDPDTPVYIRGKVVVDSIQLGNIQMDDIQLGNIQEVDYTQLATFKGQSIGIPAVMITSIQGNELLDDCGQIAVDAWGERLATQVLQDDDGKEYESVLPVEEDRAAGYFKAGKLLRVLERYDPSLPLFIHNPLLPDEDQLVLKAESSTYGFFGKSLPCLILEPT